MSEIKIIELYYIIRIIVIMFPNVLSIGGG